MTLGREFLSSPRPITLSYKGRRNAIYPRATNNTPEEALEVLYTCGALAGTYTVSGSTLTMERTANTRPESIGVTAVWEFTVEGDVMKARVVSGGAADEVTWRKVS